MHTTYTSVPCTDNVSSYLYSRRPTTTTLGSAASRYYSSHHCQRGHVARRAFFFTPFGASFDSQVHIYINITHTTVLSLVGLVKLTTLPPPPPPSPTSCFGTKAEAFTIRCTQPPCAAIDDIFCFSRAGCAVHGLTLS